MSKDDGRSEDYVFQVRDNTRRYVEELISENESLRLIVTSLERQRTRHEREHADLRRHMEAVDREHEEMLARAEEIERQNNDLANLYVASYRLHETLARDEVISVIQEIVINLIGSEELAIFEADADGKPQLLASFGVDPGSFEPVPLSSARIGRVQGVVERVIRSGERYVAEPDEEHEVEKREGAVGLTACVPLMLSGRPIGAIAVFELLEQKEGLVPLDFELFDLLATHAATALYCSRLRNSDETPSH